MELQKVVNLLDTTSDDNDLTRFVTKNGLKFMINQEKTTMLTKKLELKLQCREQIYVILGMHILLQEELLLLKYQTMQEKTKALHLKIMHHLSTGFQINAVQIENAEDLDVVMPMYNLLEYSANYRRTTVSLWKYYRGKRSNPLSSNSESFKYKTSITGHTYNIGAGEAGYDADRIGENKTEVVIPLKHLSSFWRTLNTPLINCKIELILAWSINCALADITVREA